jgi:hypothetical protein
MRKYWYAPLTVLAAAMAFVMMASASASATAVLTLGSAGGPDVSVGDTLTGSLKSSTTANFTSTPGGATGVFCSSSTFTGTVTSNPPAGGTASGTLDTQSFSSCTDTITGVTGVNSVVVNNLSYVLSVNGTTKVVTLSPGTAGPIKTTIKLNTVFGLITCVYQAHNTSLTGSASNTDNSINFTDQQFDKISGPSSCFANGFFTATYAPILDQTQGNQAVFVN